MGTLKNKKAMKDYSQYKTDEERLKVMHELRPCEFGIVATWEQEAENIENQHQFHAVAVSLYHQDEFQTYGEV